MDKRQASNFYSQFNQAERPTIDKLVGLFNNLIFGKNQILTDFLDPAQSDILKTIVGSDAYLQEFGGYKDAEKQRIIINKTWDYQDSENFQVQALEIEYPTRFAKLSHSSILGTLANSGVEISTFGDIITNGEGKWQFFVKKDLSDFFIEQIDRIGRTKVKLRPINFRQVLIPLDDSKELELVVNSLRVDAILAAASKDSRTHIKQDIEVGNSKLNWHEINNSNIMVKENDVLSLRHFGRLQVSQISTTKKGKLRVVLKLWQTKKRA